MKIISEFKEGEVVRFADADYEIINQHVLGCTVRQLGAIEINGRIVSIKKAPIQVSNMTEIQEGL